jgi:uncharacterized protein (TIGR02145 family)
MNKIIFILLTIISFNTYSQIKIGNHPESVGASSLLELESTTKALVLSRVITTAAIASPVNGMIVYDLSSNCIKAYENGAWTNCLSNGSTIEPSTNGTAIVSSYSCSATTSGTMIAGTSVASVTQTITANVTSLGTYNIVSIANGVVFSAAGTFSGTGNQNVVLTATGTPTAAGTYSYSLNTTPNCNFSRTTISVPSTPTITSIIFVNGSPNIYFSAPFDGGTPITQYSVEENYEGITVSGLSSPLVMEQLNFGDGYNFKIRAKNYLGWSPWSSFYSAYNSPLAPEPPRITSVTALNAQVSVAFSAFSRGSPITRYTVTSSPDGITETGESSPLVVTGLTNGTTYTFKVVATNAIGNSEASMDSTPVTPYSVPSAPTITSVTAGNARVSVAFNLPASNGGSPITSYTVASSPDGITETGESSPLVVTGLTNGVTYTFKVVATNAAGDSVDSNESNTVSPCAVPNAPTITSVTAGNAQVSVAFTVPASNGCTVTGYTVASSPVGFTATEASSPIVVTGLTNGVTYTFKVVATNAAGNSVDSNESNTVIPSTFPDAPTITSVTAGNAQVSVAFNLPASNGGSPITSYTVRAYPPPSSGNSTVTGTSSPIDYTGLTNGASYQFDVLATNTAGNSQSSSRSVGVTPNPPCGENVTFTYNGSSVTYGTVLGGGKCWLDRNLGAQQVATSKTDSLGYGDLFQWGRLADGHQLRTSTTTTTLSTTDTPGDNKFIISQYDDKDWRSTTNNNLWQSPNRTNNPCPDGFRLPTLSEFHSTITFTPSVADKAYSSNLKLPLAGSRNIDGSIVNVGIQAYYWSSDISYINGVNYSKSIEYAINGYDNNYYRSGGYSVRCIKD